MSRDKRKNGEADQGKSTAQDSNDHRQSIVRQGEKERRAVVNGSPPNGLAAAAVLRGRARNSRMSVKRPSSKTIPTSIAWGGVKKTISRTKEGGK